MKRLSFNMALSGILSAVCIIMMFFVSFLSVFVYVLPMICGIIMFAVYYECGTKYAVASYACVSTLLLLLVPDKEAVLLYIGLLGYYPILKIYIERIKLAVLRWIIKLVMFNISMIAIYYLLIEIIGIVSVSDFVNDGAKIWIWAFLGFGNFVFILYDIVLKLIVVRYVNELRKKLFKRK